MGLSKKQFVLFAAAGFGLLMCILILGRLKKLSKGARPEATISADALTRSVVSDYGSSLIPKTGSGSDVLNLGPAGIRAASETVRFLKAGGPAILFNGKPCASLELVEDGEDFFLAPGCEGRNEEDRIRLISKETFTEADLQALERDPVTARVVKMTREYLAATRAGTPDAAHSGADRAEFRELKRMASELESQGLSLDVLPESVRRRLAEERPGRRDPGFKALAAGVRAFLDDAAARGELARYHYDPEADSLALELQKGGVPRFIMPISYARAVDFILDAYADPRRHASSMLEGWRSRLKGGEVLVADTATDPPLFEFLDRAVVVGDLETLADAEADEEAKIRRLSGGIRFSSSQGAVGKEARRPVSGPTPGLAWAAASPFSVLGRDGAVVPPGRKVRILLLPDNVIGEELKRRLGHRSQELGRLREAFHPYHVNGYDVEVLIMRWGDKVVETLASLLGDQEVSVLLISGHAGIGADGVYRVGVEMYDSASKDLVSDSEERRRAKESYLARAVELEKSGFGPPDVDWFDKPLWPAEFSDAWVKELGEYRPLMAESMLRLLKEAPRLYSFALQNSFFKKHMKKKAVFMTSTCWGSKLSNVVDARVVLASDFKTNLQMFARYDLAKLAPYLVQKREPGPVPVAPKTKRNYRILGSFKQDQATDRQVGGRLRRDDDTNIFHSRRLRKSDRLCTVRLVEGADKTVSVAPHVESADGGGVRFNAPMDDGVPASEVVTIDASACRDTGDAPGKPEWESDTKIRLPWRGKLVRDWTPSDLSGRMPSALAKITVHSAKAVSPGSGISLTGNPDCCTDSGCDVKAHWADPAALECNATRPGSDFVFFLPCGETYYKHCRPEKTRFPFVRLVDVTDAYPEWILVRGGNYRKTNEVPPSGGAEVPTIRFWNEVNPRHRDHACIEKEAVCKKDVSRCHPRSTPGRIVKGVVGPADIAKCRAREICQCWFPGRPDLKPPAAEKRNCKETAGRCVEAARARYYACWKRQDLSGGSISDTELNRDYARANKTCGVPYVAAKTACYRQQEACCRRMFEKRGKLVITP